VGLGNTGGWGNKGAGKEDVRESHAATGKTLTGVIAEKLEGIDLSAGICIIVGRAVSGVAKLPSEPEDWGIRPKRGA